MNHIRPFHGTLHQDYCFLMKRKSPEGRRLATKNLNRKHSRHKKPTRETLIAPPPLSSLSHPGQGLPLRRTPRTYIYFIRYQSFSLMPKQINDPVVCAGNCRKSHQMKTQEPRYQVPGPQTDLPRLPHHGRLPGVYKVLFPHPERDWSEKHVRGCTLLI